MKNIYKLLLGLSLFFLIDYFLSKTKIPTNTKSYLLGYEHFVKSARESLGTKRIILVGGSSLAWGVSAENLSEKLGIQTLNSGIHANVGYRRFFGTLEGLVDKENDIFVISPEYTIVSLNSRFKRSNKFCEISIFVLNKYPFECIGYSLAKLLKILPIIDRPSGDYFNSGFNSYGDYVYRRTGINMKGAFEDIDECIGWSIENLEKSYLPYIDSLIAEGYKIIYIPNFISQNACSKISKVKTFHAIMNKKFGIQSLRDQRLFFDDSYFYDTPYHLTKRGVSIKTEIFMNHLSLYLDKKNLNTQD